MNYVASGALGLTFASCVYMQAYNASIDMLRHMEKLMDTATATLSIDSAGNVVIPSTGSETATQVF